MSEAEFKKWPSIPREVGEQVVVTEKIDGTNACVIIKDDTIIGVQSRNRLITPDDDNYGFARWVGENNDEIVGMGDGYHYGEWAGLGIQKNPYALEEKKFFLFNTARWNENNPNLPDCCNVVPILYSGEYDSHTLSKVMYALEESGSHLDTGELYQKYVEGIVAYYTKTRRYAKTTFNYKRGKWDKQ